MVKKIDISTVSASAMKDLLPIGALVEIQRRLYKKGHYISYRTVLRAFENDYSKTDNVRLVLRECLLYLEERKARAKVTVMPELAEELADRKN